MLVTRWRCRLDQKNVAPTDVLLDFYVSLTVGERTDRRLAKGHADVFADSLGQLTIGRAADDLHFWRMSEHEGLNCRALSCLAMIKNLPEPNSFANGTGLHER